MGNISNRQKLHRIKRDELGLNLWQRLTRILLLASVVGLGVLVFSVFAPEWDKLKEMDHINPTMETADVAIVIGANDGVNPVALTDPNSPIAGMPIIEVGKARTVIVIKRSLSPGFAGIPNPLFAADNTLMLFGDGQDAVLEIVSALKENA